MEIEEFSDEPRYRYYVEDVAQFIERALGRQSPSVRAEWAWLPEQLRMHPAPYFHVTPSTRIVDLVTKPTRYGSA